MKTAFAVLLALFALVSPATAGDFAERQILGFSPDGQYFAFEQFGVQDGSGFPYADIFIIDTATDSWLTGSPYRVLLKDERAELSWARKEGVVRAGNTLKKLGISKPGRLLASNPPAELSADPHRITVNPRFAVPPVNEPWTYRLEEIPLNLPRCQDLLGGPAKGYRLTVQPFKGETKILHADTAIPKSRGCPMRYALSDIVLHEQDSGRRVFAVLISVYSFGFEGPDRRFIAVTHVAE